MAVTVRPLTGAALDAALDDLARLRITVFRDWPYLYDGDMTYERRYVDAYRDEEAMLVGAFDGAMLVGAATGIPMTKHADDFAAPLAAAGISAEEVYYCAESVLLPEYRGRGIGHAFFDHRESHARSLGLPRAAFAAVIRPEDHPMKPPGYRPLDGFWRKRGYAPIPGAIARFSWLDVGQRSETDKPLQLWIRSL